MLSSYAHKTHHTVPLRWRGRLPRIRFRFMKHILQVLLAIYNKMRSRFRLACDIAFHLSPEAIAIEMKARYVSNNCSHFIISHRYCQKRSAACLFTGDITHTARQYPPRDDIKYESFNINGSAPQAHHRHAGSANRHIAAL